MIGPNLSAWSLRRPSLVVFLMLITVAAGVLAFKKLGRDEDAPFTVRTMIVRKTTSDGRLSDHADRFGPITALLSAG